MTGHERSSRHDEGTPRTDGSVGRRLAGGERDPEPLELGGKRSHADSSRRQSIAGEPDEDGLNAEQHR